MGAAPTRLFLMTESRLPQFPKHCNSSAAYCRCPSVSIFDHIVHISHILVHFHVFCCAFCINVYWPQLSLSSHVNDFLAITQPLFSANNPVFAPVNFYSTYYPRIYFQILVTSAPVLTISVTTCVCVCAETVIVSQNAPPFPSSSSCHRSPPTFYVVPVGTR